MAANAYGHKINPHRRLREPLGVKGIRQSVIITNNPSSVDQNHNLLVRFPNLGDMDVIVPGSTRLAFTISLESDDDANRTIVNNIGRAIVKKITIKLSGNEVMSIDDADIFNCYKDLWKTAQERENDQYQGIDTSNDQNVTKLRIGAGDAVNTKENDKAISDTFGNRFYIPLDFELLETHMPYYQSALGDRLEYELFFNKYSNVIKSTDTDASYQIENISLEFDKITEPELARMIRNQYNRRLVILYDRILRHRIITANKSDTLWNINLNVPARSMKGILLLFEDPAAPYQRDSEKFYNPKIKKVEITIEGVPNQLYSQGLLAHQIWQESKKFPAKVKPKVLKDLSDVSLNEFLTNKYSLWLDLRTTDDDKLHGNGRRIENASEGITLQITKTAETAGKLNIYVYVIMDAQLNIENGKFVSALF